MAKKDYYKILKVSKNDSGEDIKKSYKKLALKYHPDRADSSKKAEYEKKFQEINEAYSVLGNEEKRKRYDRGETGNFNQRAGFSGFDFADIFRDVFGGGGFGGGFGDEEDFVDLDLHYRMTIEFEDAVFGCEKEVSIRRDTLCKKCGGTGSVDGKFETCSKCNGRGRIEKNQQTPWGVIRQVAKCDVCNGEGKIPKTKCLVCHGKGIKNNVEKVKVKIPKGIDNGQTIRIVGEGNSLKGGSVGDLFLQIQVKPHKIFQREGFDLYRNFGISFSQASLGAKVSIPTLSSEQIKIKIPKGTDSGSIFRVRGKGVSHLNHPSYKGDLFVKVVVETPKNLSRAQTKLLKELGKFD